MSTLVKKNIVKQIQNLADEKEKEIKKDYFDKYSQFYEIAISVLKKHNVLLYGGTALNEIFPIKYKFYDKEELPDIDVFCTDYHKISDDIINTFKNYGYSLTTVKEALHKNTYKIMIEGLQLIDLSVISKKLFKVLKKGSFKTILGLPTVNIDYLKYSLHIILSEPLNSWRWPKVYQRMIRLYDLYPIDTSCSFDISKYYVDLPISITSFINKTILKYNLIAFGWDVIQTYLQEDTTITKTVKKQFITTDIDSLKNAVPVQYLIINKDIDKVIDYMIKNSELKIDHVFQGDEILPKYYCLKYNNMRSVYIFESENCVSYITWKSKLILTMHSILHFLYQMYLSTEEPDIKCIIQVLTAIQLNNALSNKKLFKQFILNCYGFQKGIVTLRRERLLRQLKNKSN